MRAPTSHTKTAHKVRVRPKLLRVERSLNKKLEAASASGTKLTIKVNRPLTPEVQQKLGVNAAGNRIGLHNRDNPPSSEHMRKIRAMRQIYNRQVPVPQCNTCAFSANCPQFKAGYECAFKPFLQAHRVESVDDIRHYMRDLVAANAQRVQLASIFERLSGGAPSSELSEMYAMQFNQLRDLHEVEKDAGSVDLTLETTDGGIIGKLFGSTNNLLAETERQALAIREDLTDIPIEDGVQKPKSGTAAALELVRDLENAQSSEGPEAAPAPARSRPAPDSRSVNVSQLTRK